MPPKRKGGRANKKKKKGGPATATTPSKGNKTKSINTTTTCTNDPLLPKNLTEGAKTTPADESVGAHYQQYKKATAAFRAALSELLPSSFRLKSVDDLARASTLVLDASLDLNVFISDLMKKHECCGVGEDYMKVMSVMGDLPEEEQRDLVERFQCVLVPHHLIANLDTSIALRHQVLRRYAVGHSADNGHRHIIKVLMYCRRALKACRNTTSVIQKIARHLRWRKNEGASLAPLPSATDALDESKHDEEDEGTTVEDIDRFANRFAALASIYDDDDDDDDEEGETDDSDDDVQEIIEKRKNGIDTAPVTEETDMYSIEELINGDDRLQACSFLYTMEQLMEIVSSHYTMLKNDTIATECSDLKMLTQCAMVANTCIYSIQRAEATLAINCPHLSSFYAVLVIVYLPSLLTMFEERILSHTTEAAKKKCDKATLVRFLGTIVECCFHNRADNRRNELTQKFIKKIGLERQQAEVETLVHAADTMTHLEIQNANERNMGENRAMCEMLQSQLGMEGEDITNRWLNAHQFIGGKHSIINTLRWLQCVLSISNDDTKLMSKPGFFGKLWDEERNLAKGIRGDMDELFCGSILPELLEWCKTRITPRRRGGRTYVPILDSVSPYTSQTIPILHMLRDHMKNKKDAVPASLAFGMHCLLTSIFELQGNGDVARHAVNAEQSWNNLFQKLEEHKEETDAPNHDSFFHNVEKFVTLRYLTSPIGDPSTAVSARMAFFNPLMAGSYLLFANYVIGLGLGSCTVDSIGQMRFVMHLYNAFVKTGHLKEDENNAPRLLKEADIVFKDIKALWVLKERPSQGEFAKHFLISWGFTPMAAAKAIKNSNFKLSGRPQNDCRNLDPILPEEMSSSYRMVMNRDFTGVIDTYSIKNYTPEQKKQQEVFVQTLSNINMARDRMDDDEDNKVSFTNWTQVGCIFNEFTRAMMKEFGWDRLVREIIYRCPENVRNGVRTDGSRVKSKFEVSDVNLEYQAYSQLISNNILGALDKDPNCAVGKQCADFMKNYFHFIDEKEYSYLNEDTIEGNMCSLHDHSDDELKAMSVNKLKKLAIEIGVDLSGCLEKKEIVHLLCSPGVGKNDNSPFIRGTNVLKTTMEGVDPTGTDLQFPPDRNGNLDTPLYAMMLFKYTKRNKEKCRLILPGKNSPVVELGVFPYDREPPQLVQLPGGKYRHIASFSLKELCQIGWDGAIYHSQTVGTWVPYIDGYDSDENDQYELFNKREARSKGLIGLPIDMVGKYILRGGMNGEPEYMQLRR